MDRASPEQVRRYRAMTPAQRLQQAEALNEDARRLRAAYERQKHPDWSDDAIAAYVRRIFLRATT
jgi:hypothetical protein